FNQSELATIQTSMEHMLHDVRILQESTLEASHNGRLEVVYQEQTGHRGRPRIIIDRDFLAWAYRLRSTSGIARFLGVGRTVVRQALLDYHIVEPGSNPFAEDVGQSSAPEFIQGSSRDNIAQPASIQSPPLAGYLSDITNAELDAELQRLYQNFPHAGLRMLDGMLRTLGFIVPRGRVRESLHRIDPVQRVFDLIHAFIDGYSRLITGIRASPNNLASTVLRLFLDSTATYGIPSRV
ncbi:hypothetical protein F5890DRAFT_1391376, partial [Lentinula detonsa]